RLSIDRGMIGPGRLFWKLFFSSLCALVVVALGVGTTVWLHRPDRSNARELAGGPGVELATAFAAAPLREAGPDALRSALRGVGGERFPNLYVVDEDGRDLLDRSVPATSLARAKKAGAESKIARKVAVAGHAYAIFVPMAPPGG